MSFTHSYSVPAYYPDFHCKAGDCRHPCCTGWDITISMTEYFHMLGMDCSPELRRRLDTAFHLADEPSEDRYAIISPRWDGDCPLHLPNGFCGLQCECGEGAIPSICRYYPRSPKSKYAYQCQCSNSCEAVVELLFSWQETMTFLRQRLSFAFSEPIPHEHDPITRLFPAVQRACLHILQDRTRPFSLRLRHLGEMTIVMDVPYRQGNAAGIQAVLPFYAVAGGADKIDEYHPLSDRELTTLLTCLRDLLLWIEQNNEPLRASAVSARNLLKMPSEGEIGSESIRLWRAHEAAMAERFPDNDRMLEQVFVNHLCYDGFPFSAEHQNLWDSYLAFTTAYALVRLLSVCHLAAFEASEEKEHLTPTAAYADIVATIFRMVAHTNFGHNAAILARRFSYEHPQTAFLLCRL